MRSDVRRVIISSRKYRARTGRPRDKKGDPQALMMLLLAFRNCIIAFSCQGGAAAEERKEASWTRPEEVGTSCWRRSQGATYWKWKKRHVTPHVGLQVAEARNEKRAKKKMELRQRRKEEAGAINFKASLNSDAEMFRLIFQDPEAWRAQKQKDNRRQQKCRAKKSLRRKTLRKLLEVRHAVQIWLWWPQCLQHRRTTTTWRFWRSCQRCRRGTGINESYHFVTIKDSWTQHDKQNLSHHYHLDRRGGNCWSSWRKKREYVLSKFTLAGSDEPADPFGARPQQPEGGLPKVWMLEKFC